MNRLFKLTRLSETNRPVRNEKCFFSPVTRLVTSIYNNDNRKLLRDYMRELNTCTIIKNMDRCELVHFSNAKQTDIVSTEFLLRFELTTFGKQLLGGQPNVYNKTKGLTTSKC